MTILIRIGNACVPYKAKLQTSNTVNWSSAAVISFSNTVKK